MIKRISAIILTSILLMTGCSSTDNTTTVEDTSSQDVVTFPTIGETISTNGLDILVNEVKEIENGKLITLNEGEKLVAIDMTITNNTAENYIFSSPLLLDVINEEGYGCALEIFSQNNVKPLDGDIPPGTTKRGEHVFRTTSDLATVTMSTELGGEKITFKLK